MDERSLQADDESACTLELSAEAIKERIFDETDPSTSGTEDSLSTPPFTLYGLTQFMGSGFMMSVAFLDPGNLEAGKN
jgi:hypothetical protein